MRGIHVLNNGTSTSSNTAKEKASASLIDLDDCGDTLADKIDLLSEKRTAVRDAALRDINYMLSLRFCGHHLQNRVESLSEALAKAISRGGETELRHITSTIALTSISLLVSRDAFFRRFRAPLVRLITNDSEDIEPVVREKAVDALAVLCLTHATLESGDVVCHLTEVAQIFEDVLTANTGKKNSGLCCSALNAWMLLLTCLPDINVREAFERSSSIIMGFLDDTHDVRVRVAACKIVAIAAEAMRNHFRALSEDSEVPVDPEIDMLSPTSDLGMEAVDLMNEILVDKSKYKSDADRKKQRKTLRSMIAYIEEDADPSHSIMIRDHLLLLNSWKQIFRMDALKTSLGEGYMTHLEQNSNIMTMFDYFIDITEDLIPTMTKRERRLSLSESAKHLQKHRNSEREYRSAGYATD